MKRYAILILLLGLTATFANAQFPIRIPKIKIPKVEQPKPENTPQPHLSNNPTQNQPNQATQTDQSSNRKSVLPSTNTSGEPKLLDSKTQLNLEEVRVSHKVVGWNMKSNFWLKGDIPKRSALRIFVKKNGKELISYRCEIEIERVIWCIEKKNVVKELGILDVDVNFINGDTDEEKPIRSYKIDVHRTERFNDFAHFFVNRHPDVAVAYLSIEGLNSLRSRPGTYPVSKEHKYQLTFNTLMSRDSEEMWGGDSYLRCSLNGQPFKLKSSRVSSTDAGFLSAVYESKHLTGTKKGSVYKDYLKFGHLRVKLPLALGTDSRLISDISSMPGNWECKIIRESDRELVRTFRFTLDANGQIVTHPEQRSGNVVFADWEYMIDMDIPPGGSTLDYRLKPFPKMGFFHGIPWTTPEGKAAAESVPTKGNPFPLPAK